MTGCERKPTPSGVGGSDSTASSDAGRYLTGPGFKYEAEAGAGVRVGKPGVGWVSPRAKREPARTCHPRLGERPMARPVAARANTTAEAHTTRCGLPCADTQPDNPSSPRAEADPTNRSTCNGKFATGGDSSGLSHRAWNPTPSGVGGGQLLRTPISMTDRSARAMLSG